MEKQKYVLKATQNGHVIYNNTFDSREDYEIARKALEELNAMNVNDNSAESFEIISSEDKKKNISEGAINFSKDNSKYPTLVFDPDDLIEDYTDEYEIESANDTIREVYEDIKEEFQLGSNQEIEDAKNYANIRGVNVYLGVPNTSSELACIEVKAGYDDGFQLSIATPRLEDLTSNIRYGYTSFDEEMADADIKNMLDEAEKNAVEFLKKLHLEYPDSKFLHKAGWVPSYSDNFEEACDSKTSGKMLKEEYGPWHDDKDGSIICKDIADDLENGNTFGSLSDYQGNHLTNWKATINGKDVEDVVSSSDVLDWILRELSYPVADGHIYYRDLNLFFNNYSYSNYIDIYDEQVQQDLIALGFDEDKIKEMVEKDIPEDGSTDDPDFEEIECWIDFDIEFYNGCESMDDVVEKYAKSMGIDEAKEISDDEYEFRVARKNALANPNLYGGRYTQKNIRDARKEYLADKEARKSQKINESADDVLKATVKDWYKETYPTDDLGDEISDTVTFEEIAHEPNRVYELLNVNDSLIRERVFQEISSRGKIPYDDLYKNWLGESKQADSMKLLKKNLQKINESFNLMNTFKKKLKKDNK